MSPTFASRSAVVTLPMALKLHSMKPCRVGELAMQKVLSPAPKMLYSPNWPALKSKLSRTASSWNSRRRVRVSAVSSTTSVTVVSSGW